MKRKPNIAKAFSDTVDRRPAGNSTYKKLAVHWFNEALCFVTSSLLTDRYHLRNRQLFVAAKRWWQVYQNRPQTNWQTKKCEQFIHPNRRERNTKKVRQSSIKCRKTVGENGRGLIVSSLKYYTWNSNGTKLSQKNIYWKNHRRISKKEIFNWKNLTII